MVQKSIRNNRRIDERPCSDIARCDVICRTSAATSITLKLVPGRPVSFVDVAALGTHSGSISRIHQHDLHPSDLCFIGDKLPELVERPRTLAAALRLSNRGPIEDAFQIFEGNLSLGVLGLSHQFLGNAMVCIGSESILVPRQTLEMPLGGSRAAGLQILAKLRGLAAHPLNVGTGVSFTVGIDRDVDDAEVHAEDALGRDWLGIWDFDNGAEIKHIINQNEVRLTSNTIVQLGCEIIVENDRNDCAPVECQYGYSVCCLPGEDALVIDHRAVWPEVRLDCLVQFIGFDSLGDGANRHLSGQAEPLTCHIVNNRMELDLVGGFQLECHASDVIAGEIELLHCSEQGGVLFCGCAEFDLECQLHSNIDIVLPYTYTFLQFLPALKSGVSLEAFL